MPNLNEMLAAALAGLRDARVDGNEAAEAYRAAEAGDLHYRLGDAAAAFEHLVLALQLGAGDDSPEDDLALEVCAAQAARRAGLLSEAQRGFERALEHPLAKAPAPRAALLAELAFTTASQDGAHDEGARLFAEAIKIAREGDAVEAMVHALRLRGESALAAQRFDEAGAAFARALEISQDGAGPAADDEGDDEAVPVVGSAELFGVLVGLHESRSAGDEVLLGALALVPDALREAEPWWALPRLLPGVLRLSERGYLGEPALFEPLRLLADAASQRADCAELREALRSLDV